jgi:hypothetical protein
MQKNNFLLLRPCHGEHGPKLLVTMSELGVHRFAAGAAKLGVYVMQSYYQHGTVAMQCICAQNI